MADKEDTDLDAFLANVDQIQNIIKDLKSGDDEVVKNAAQKADKFLAENVDNKGKVIPKQKYPAPDRTGVNRTVINKEAFKDAPAPQPEGMSQEAFMAAIEKDCEERAQRRAARHKQAEPLRLQGNEQFKQGNYEEAVKFYTEAIGIAKDVASLYTNRAQAHNKLGKYSEALVDCDWALRITEDCLKAYIHQGKAYLGLKEYEKATESYLKALEIDPKKKTAIEDYIAEVEQARIAETEEEAAKTWQEMGSTEAQTVSGVMEKLQTKNQLPLYYSGGMRLIKTLLGTTEEKTLFRTLGGLQLIQDHPSISNCFTATVASLSREQIDLLSAAFDMCTAACTDNVENQKQIFDMEGFPDKVLLFLETERKHTSSLKEAVVKFLHILSETDMGSIKIAEKINTKRLIDALFPLMRRRKGLVLSLSAVGVLNNMTLNKKFLVEIRKTMDDTLLPAFENLMKCTNVCLSVLAPCISTMANLAADTYIRQKTVERDQTWDGLVKLLEKNMPEMTNKLSEDVVYNAVGLLLNLTIDKSETGFEYYPRICRQCCELINNRDTRLMPRTVQLLSQMLPNSPDAVPIILEMNVITSLLNMIRSNDASVIKSAVKCISACTLHSEECRTRVVYKEKGLKPLLTCLTSQDEVVVGNAALALSHVAEDKKVCARLTETNIVQDLLVLTRDGRKPQLQQNCAILLAKLARGDTRHLSRLRDLHGIEILHDCLKHTNMS